MKQIATFLGAAIILLSVGCSTQRVNRTADRPEGSHIAISYNIRVNVASDGEHAWPHRADHVARLLRFHGAEIAGLQEATAPQIDDLVDRLPEYDWYGVGREDGAEAGEFVPIFYRRDRYTAVDRGVFWLSSTPETPGSVGWDAALPRVTTWVLLEDHTGARFYVFNTHFDHRGAAARAESAKLLRHMVASRAKGSPVLVMGDFNTRPDSEPYEVMLEDREDGMLLRDAFNVATPYGPDLTFSSFEVGREEEGRIDYVFVTKDVRVLRTGVLTDQYRGSYPSDHLPVLAEIVI